MIWHKGGKIMNVDERIEKMKAKNKGRYLTQGVSFNKDCPRQMELLKFALENSVSFSGLVKELLALKFSGAEVARVPKNTSIQQELKPKSKNIGNFI